jgi:DNA-binding response OmpR family regulator
MRLLLAESDPALATSLYESFAHELYSVDLTGDGQDAKRWVEERSYDLVILDLNLVRVEATKVLQSVRTKWRHVPVLVLCSRDRSEERVEILDMGADDLVLKPCAFSELSARVRALLRRVTELAETVLSLDDLELDRVEHSVKRGGRVIELTPKEFGLLECLMRNAGKQVSRAQILEQVWNLRHDTSTNVVDVYVSYLRNKINGPKDNKLIHTVRGIGYEIHAPADRLGPQLVASKG